MHVDDRSEQRWLAPLSHQGHFTKIIAYMCYIPKYHILVKSLFLHLINYKNKITSLFVVVVVVFCFHLKAILFILLLLSKNKSEIRFQNLV